MHGKYIIIEGNIGAGKSTLAAALAQKIGAELQLEPAEGKNPYLPLYYKDPARYSFVMQVFLLHQRLRAHKEAQALCLSPAAKNVVADRSYWGDLCFANIQKRLGYFTDDDYKTYTGLHKDMQENLLYPSCIIHLKSDPQLCAKRVQRRMEQISGRQCESSIDFNYLNMLDGEINMMVLAFSKIVPVIEVEPMRDGTEIALNTLVDEIITKLNLMEEAHNNLHGDYRGIAWQGVGGFYNMGGLIH